MTKTIPIRVLESDWKWLMNNRGLGNVPEKIHELIENEKKRLMNIQGSASIVSKSTTPE